MANFGENTRDFLQFPIYYYDVTYSMSLPVRGIGGAAGVIMNGWDPINLVPSLAHVSAAGALSVEGSISATTSATATAAAPSYVEGSTDALSMDLAGSLRVTGVTSGGLTDAQLRAVPVPVSGTVTSTIANLDVALSTRTKPSDQQHVIVDSSASIAVTNANLDVALSTRTKPSDQQHVIIDSSASIAVTGPLTDTQIRATPLPVSGTVAVTGTFYQTTQPVSIATLPNPANLDAPISQLIGNQIVENFLQAQQLAVARTGSNGFIPMVEVPGFMVGF